MADRPTLEAYDTHAAQYAQDWLDQAPPDDMYALLEQHFAPGPTADVGCGAGRDTAWLAARGFDVRGYDASAALLDEARRHHPSLQFEVAALPALAGVPSRAFRNVLCETVVMHLEPADAAAAAARLADLLMPGGTLYLSWRVAGSGASRDERGRLYASLDAARMRAALGADMRVIDEHEVVSASSGKRVHRLIARKADAAA
ncbi:methyltransferase domain-containing protein [Burkholderia multivorans]|jgi:2-polyprenyl-3-methyl-5-hydroxy-6-metoxy-1,4-benzoquinol methylase|uniref:class I SAM-dependent methyltransferase n=1 Tax=Burkholderia multivorans TaxID=87883 RepID=UPI00018E329E|nr:methyltransferase domain-containing protein [Burkholderia multivorans]EEE01279.1 methyltransferase type 11 [Burkholderia multivorans CGD1]KHS10847.1 SAM-dependent methyltransferase [Burkholderia multivorans]KHS17895.1 SAM-dependent methyltransferase [Burkholderia multivorans]KVT47365.1 SAM-dependent methyltransferase [Burkholderia multivorans]MBJ9614745.1 methyltransferase domain-containing protein [Burkholderia multivorans]